MPTGVQASDENGRGFEVGEVKPSGPPKRMAPPVPTPTSPFSMHFQYADFGNPNAPRYSISRNGTVGGGGRFKITCREPRVGQVPGIERSRPLEATVTDLLPAAIADDSYTGLVPAHLIERAKDYARASKAASTLRTYEAVWAGFASWCATRGLCPLPACAETVVIYVSDQAERLRPVTLKKHLAAISQVHKMAGQPSPVQTEPVRLVMQGIRRVKGTASQPKKALRVDHLKKMVAALPGGAVGIRDKAILLLGFAAGMRRSEIVGLDVGDVAFEPEGAVITIRRSKRDQEAKGRQVALLRGRHETTCPVRAVRAWLEVSGATPGPLFVRLDLGAPRVRLNGRAVAHVVQRASGRAGLDPDLFSGHSLRRGFCTEAARAGAAERDIARTTGHASMAVLRSYVEAGTIFEGCAARVLDL